MSFIDDNFLLQNRASERLYHEYAAPEPILDFHSHLPPEDIADAHQFADLTEIWLKGDHYKWRLMRAHGVDERFCTGDASPYEKFMAWAATVPFALRSPLYHWTHLEMKRYFGFDELLNQRSADDLWKQANGLLQTKEFSTTGILNKFRVSVVCSTDDPCDDLGHHRKINESQAQLRLYPTFRPDKALNIDDAPKFNSWVDRLAQASNVAIRTLRDFLDAVKRRHDAFHEAGCRLSDHGLVHCFSTPCSDGEAGQIFEKVRSGNSACPEDQEKFASFMMLFFGRLDAEKGWTKQLHLGALRSTNTRGLRELGPDTGFDSIGDSRQASSLCAYLDLLDRENALPRMILYNLNPADNYLFATAAGNFQQGPTACKIQFGSGWWFLDQKDGIRNQLDALSNCGMLAHFVGMVTDSRSFMSFPRHEYFRRVLCDCLGQEMEMGELPNDFELVGGMIRNICFENARRFLKLKLPAKE